MCRIESLYYVESRLLFPLSTLRRILTRRAASTSPLVFRREKKEAVAGKDGHSRHGTESEGLTESSKSCRHICHPCTRGTQEDFRVYIDTPYSHVQPASSPLGNSKLADTVLAPGPDTLDGAQQISIQSEFSASLA